MVAISANLNRPVPHTKRSRSGPTRPFGPIGVIKSNFGLTYLLLLLQFYVKTTGGFLKELEEVLKVQFAGSEESSF